MKHTTNLLFFLLLHVICFSQSGKVILGKTACNERNVQWLPALYYDHTFDNYSKSKSPRMAYLFNIEKIEQNSRKNFQVTGCALHVYTRPGHGAFDMDGVLREYSGFSLLANGYYCHSPQNTVSEGSTVAEISVLLNSTIPPHYAGKGDFYITNNSVRYEVATQMIRSTGGPKYPGAKYSKISTYMSEYSALTGIVDRRDINHTNFLKIINGEGYLDKHGGYNEKYSDGYKTIERYYSITKPGVPVLVPVSRREFLEALLEYYEIEKTNFINEAAAMVRNENYKNRISILEADKVAYNKMYEAKKERITNLLKTKSADWLNKQVATQEKVRENDKSKASNGLFDFYDFENGTLLYKYNPGFTKNKDRFKPVIISVRCIYRYGNELYQWSENLVKNFEKNFDFEALRKMLE